jgi:hypothetical protein
MDEGRIICQVKAARGFRLVCCPDPILNQVQPRTNEMKSRKKKATWHPLEGPSAFIGSATDKSKELRVD